MDPISDIEVDISMHKTPCWECPGGCAHGPVSAGLWKPRHLIRQCHDGVQQHRFLLAHSHIMLNTTQEAWFNLAGRVLPHPRGASPIVLGG
ncbi:hypothetical protein VTJ83DRAFT_5948 [Remersonia thermophila]|uniref:Uncharacterized protein n=1 Tax=Remersonia thermophila TaxID=72144 RepID=A0ABR4D8F4_9PEZI